MGFNGRWIKDRWLFISGISALLFILAGCSSNLTYAPVISNGYEPAPPGYYQVKAGDTLYSIAWNFSLDYRQLAAINQISAPYAINEGQYLRIKPPVSQPMTTSMPLELAPPIRSSLHTSPTLSAISSSVVIKPAIKPASTPVSPIAPVVTPDKIVVTDKIKVTEAAVKTAKPLSNSLKNRLIPAGKQSAPVVISDSTTSTTSSITHWYWPVSGTIITQFAPLQGSKGIDIVAKLGTPISATAAGQVVYCGNGLTGYGNLIIIKHNADFLSAYAHTQKILVHEGQKVTAGQKIALMGSTDSDRVKLHFEIRLKGSPVDPSKYLPTR